LPFTKCTKTINLVNHQVGIFGSALGPDASSSIAIAKRMLEGTMPGLPHISLGIVDVRDVVGLLGRMKTSCRRRRTCCGST
jgi:dihydroflavonol-4-reductase